MPTGRRSGAAAALHAAGLGAQPVRRGALAAPLARRRQGNPAATGVLGDIAPNTLIYVFCDFSETALDIAAPLRQ